MSRLLCITVSSAVFLTTQVFAQRIYWTDIGTKKIQRAKLDGSDIEDLVTSGLDYPCGLAVDREAGKLYWADGATSKIQRANLDGSDAEVILWGLTAVKELAIDLSAQKIYWSDERDCDIKRANLDGTGTEVVVTPAIGLPRFMALSTDKLYWANAYHAIERANLDGTNVETVVAGLGTPVGIALGPAHVIPAVSTWGLAVLALLLVGAATVMLTRYERLVASGRQIQGG